MDDHRTSGLDSTSRRTVLAGAAIVGAGAVLAACGGETDASRPSAATTTTAPSGGPGTPVGKASDVPVGEGIYADAAKAFVSQPAPGTFKAFDAICTHRQCAMTKIEGATISCLCHGSQFSALDGSVKHGPASTPLTAVKVVEKDGSLFVQG
jgi:nitrite reductase/ring-hydroxylating ferredoxin subunit